MARPRYELWGESLLELGVLLLVFVPLDILVGFVKNGQQPTRFHREIISAFAFIGFALIVLGIEMERRGS